MARDGWRRAFWEWPLPLPQCQWPCVPPRIPTNVRGRTGRGAHNLLSRTCPVRAHSPKRWQSSSLSEHPCPLRRRCRETASPIIPSEPIASPSDALLGQAREFLASEVAKPNVGILEHNRDAVRFYNGDASMNFSRDPEPSKQFTRRVRLPFRATLPRCRDPRQIR